MTIKHRHVSPVTLGADPELFLTDESGKYISSIGRFGGTKQKPRQLGKLAGMAVQEDNVAVEFNIPPVLRRVEFRKHIQTALKLLEKEARAMQLKLAVVSSTEFEPDQLDNPKAQVFGCDPDFNVWTLRQNPSPKPTNKRLRSAGGHIHFAYTKDRIGLGRALDLFQGCPSILFDPDQNRRLLYGKAGAVRQKEYGLEYRTLSSFWIKSPELTDMVFSQGVQAIEFVEAGHTIPEQDARKIIKCINESDQRMLVELTEKYGLMY